MYQQGINGVPKGMFEYYMYVYDIYVEKYDKIALLLQNGSFYEIYGVDNETEKLGNIVEVCDVMNLKVGKKDNKQSGNDRSNHLLGGFQPAQFDKYAPILIDNGFTLVVIEQFGKDENDEFIRKVSKVVSSSTYLEDVSLVNTKKQKNKVLLSMYLEFNKNKELILVSMASIDLSIGICSLANITNSKFDKEKCIDETFRFIHSNSPIEVLVYIDNDNESLKQQAQKIIKDLNLASLNCSYYIKPIPAEYSKIQYQLEFLDKIYNTKNTMLDAIEYLNLSKYPSLTTAFVLLLKFAYEHDETIVKNVHYPKFWDNSNYLVLENNAIYQLNIVKTHTISNSLIDLLDKTSTPLGRRLLKERLLNPINNVDILTRRYNQISWMTDKIEVFDSFLKNILDIERIHRKIENETIQPFDFISLEKSYENIEKIMIILNEFLEEKPEYKELFNFWNISIYERFSIWRKDYNSIFNIRECNHRLENMREGFIFQSGVDSIIDELQAKIQNKKNEIRDVSMFISNKLSELQTGYKPRKKKTDSSSSGLSSSSLEDSKLIEKNSKNEYFIKLTKTRDILFKKHIEAELEKKGWFNFERKGATSEIKLTCPRLDKIGEEISELEEELQTRCLEVFFERVKNLYNTHKGIFSCVTNFIAEIDWMKSCAKVAKENYYCSPRIVSLSDSGTKSYIISKDMRHPLIEKILDGSHYVPNDISIGISDTDGILLFGTNSSGKSSLMKSVGVNVIMAQSGMFVACSQFDYYPYNNIITRMTGDDNFSKGFSSFVVEMTELRTILNRSDKNSLVLGDEICHGTEQVSGLAIVASGIIELSKKQSSFIFATHLHSLSNMEEITSLHNIKCKHLKVIYDEKEDSLVYNRKLADGAGSDLYGIEVAKYIIQDQPVFLENAMRIRRKVLEVPKEIIATKKSKYNAKLVVDKCKICGKDAVDTHHINFQCTADDDGTIETDKFKFHKNVKANLVALCKRCHINVHHSIDGKQIEIDGYSQTSKGTILKWHIKDV